MLSKMMRKGLRGTTVQVGRLAHARVVAAVPVTVKARAGSSLSADPGVAGGANAIYLESLYTQWKANSGSLSPAWSTYFEAMEAGKAADLPAKGSALRAASFDAKLASAASTGAVAGVQDSGLSVRVDKLVRAYQVRGHEIANLDPLSLHEWRRDCPSGPPELDPSFYGFSAAELDSPAPTSRECNYTTGNITLRELLAKLKATYASTVGVEYMHMGDAKKLEWIQSRVERPDFVPSSKEALITAYKELLKADTFEEFLSNKYKTTKRFGSDGAESSVSGVNMCVQKAVDLGVKEVIIGMPHRGRLNVLTNVVGKPLVQMFAEFKGTHYDFDRIMEEMTSEDWSSAGDVKYHLGTHQTKQLANGKSVVMTLECNPSHLETVCPVTLGRTKAKQYYAGNTQQQRTEIMPILFHGDASFSGQGVNYETMQLAHVADFDVGGTIHVVINNQVGFTTDPIDDRSTLYCTDLGKAFNVPILHANADDPMAVNAAFELAAEWRQAWNTDIVIDVIGYRRYGHNETDAPEYTQPNLYKVIAKHPRAEKRLYDRIIAEGAATAAELDALKAAIWEEHEKCFVAADDWKEETDWLATKWQGMATPTDKAESDATGLEHELLTKIGMRLCEVPDGFSLHPGLKRQLKKKREDIEGGLTIDWGTAEAMAYGSLLLEGNHVRITGQDVQRGTFAHRHCVIKDQKTGADHCFLNNLNLGPQETFIARNSVLSEYAVLGFETGYSYERPNQLIIWEAQFGDFANTAQVMFDQFIAAGEHKWFQQSGLTMLLPHGYMGQGAEHSSCRMERYLQMCDDDEDDIPSFHEGMSFVQSQKANWVVANVSTPANFFHIIRRQLHRNFRKPLVIASPKNLFRLKECVSPLSDFEPGSRFNRVIMEQDPDILANRDKVERIIFCSGKLVYELEKEREKQGRKDVAIVTLEQISPFPFDRVKECLDMFPNLDYGDGVHPGQIVWCQEEPKNMGAYQYVRPRFVTTARETKDKDLVIRYVGRRAAASPATGLPKLHNAEQDAVLQEAVGGGGGWDQARPTAFLGFQT